MITSKVQTANKVSGSLRATIPLEVVESLGLKEGDVVAWDVGKRTACIRRLE